MAHPIDCPELWQQILESACNCNDWKSWIEDLPMQLGLAFQVDSCLVVVPTPCQTQSQISVWIAAEAAHEQQTYRQGAKPWLNQLQTATPISISDLQTAQCPVSLALQSILNSCQLAASDACPSIPMRSLLCIATEFQGKKNGLVCLLKTQPYDWSKAELRQLQTLHHSIAIALSQFQGQFRFNHTVQCQSVINQLTLALQTTSNLNDFWALATTGTAQALQAERAFLLRLKYWNPLLKGNQQEQLRKTRVIVTCAWPASTRDPVAEQSFFLGECSLCQQALQQAPVPIVLPHLIKSSNRDQGAAIKTPLDLTTTSSLLMVPLESQGTVMGFLMLQSVSDYVWRPEDVDLVKLVSAQVTTAIIQTETLRQVQKLVEKRTAELQESLAKQAKLYERMRHQVDQLRALNQLKDQFLSTISHELRTPLTSMTMAIRMLRQIDPSDPRNASYLDILEQQCTQETNLINDLLMLQELETRQMRVQLQEIDLKVLLVHLSDSFQKKWQQKRLKLTTEWPDTPIQINSDRNGLGRVLQELLSNAAKYADPDSELQLTLTDQPPAGTITISLLNIGAGIQSDDLPHIFDKFCRGQSATPNAIPGTGLGLALVQQLVQLLKGQIVATSQPLKGSSSYQTCFRLILPQQWQMVES